MTNRTIQIYGLGFGSSDATVNVTLDGSPIFSGPVPTLNQPVPNLPSTEYTEDKLLPLCNFEIPMDYQGQKSIAYTVTNGVILIGKIAANYVLTHNVAYSESDMLALTASGITLQQRYDIWQKYASPAFNQTETDVLLNPLTSQQEKHTILVAHNANAFVSPDASIFGPMSTVVSNVRIDDVSQSPDVSQYPSNSIFWWIIHNGSTLSYDINFTSV